MKTVLKIGILLVFLFGCVEQAAQPVPFNPYQRWQSQNLHDYTIDQVRTCFCAEGGQAMRLTVRADTLALVTRLSDDSIVSGPVARQYLTIDSLFSIIRHPGTDSQVVAYDSSYGYPRKLDINPQQHPLDGGVLIENSNLRFDTSTAGCACTALFAYFSVTVVNAAGAPVAGLSPVITVVRTGRKISSSITPTGNQYPVFTDSESKYIDPMGELVRVTVSSGSTSATGDFIFDVPGACHCHMHKVSGPDTLVLR